MGHSVYSRRSSGLTAGMETTLTSPWTKHAQDDGSTAGWGWGSKTTETTLMNISPMLHSSSRDRRGTDLTKQDFNKGNQNI